MPDTTDRWAAGDLYEPYVGRWSRLVAHEFLDWLAIAPDGDWLDVGCGTGALSATIVERAAPRSVHGIDLSDAFIEYARAHVTDERATFDVGDAQQLSVRDASADVAVSGLAVNFVPEPGKAVAEMARATRPDGTVAIYVWDYADKMELMRHFWDAATDLDPKVAEIDESRRFPMCAREPLEALFTEAGLRDVEVRAIDVPTRFRDFDDYWSPFLGGQGPAPAYAMSLPGEHRNALRDLVRSRLPVADDGSIDLVARAWAVKGIR